ncbi:MAG: OadG family transporter subunit [Treponemataceae bacterium]|nr:OadG family transporter subunit [Spirochaetales bacterium]MDY6031371.1 OadG family transporter subunit [Treponemataceae bacterium]
MTIVDMLGQSLILTGLGLAVVFTFLIIMICVMYGSSALIKALKLDKKEKESQKNNAAPSAQSNESVIAAIAAAIHDKQLH